MVTDPPQFLDIDVEPLNSFRSSHPQVASQTQELLWLEWMLFSLVAHSSASFTSLTAYSFNQVHEYHREASLLCMRGRPNIGLALTRMACELSRDILRFARDNTAEKLWLSREATQKEYKEKFQFHKDSPMEKGLFEVYKLASRFGTHGHVLITNPVPTKSSRGSDFLMLRPDEGQILNSISMNLAAIRGFIIAFLSEHGEVFTRDPAIFRDARQLNKDVFNIKIEWDFRDRATQSGAS